MSKRDKDIAYENLRMEFRRDSFRDILRDNIKPICCNCECTEGIEYHHVVPLFRGGTNKLSNIVPLCNRCHQAVHYGQHVSKYRNNSHEGRPRKANLTPEVEKVLWDWANGKISHLECKEALGYSKSSHITDTPLYRDFINKHDIKSVRNVLDVVRTNGTPSDDSKVSTIVFKDNNIVVNYYGNIGDDYE